MYYIYYYVYYAYYTYYTNYVILQLSVDPEIADHVWQEKHDAIAKTVDALGDEFKPWILAGMLGYIQMGLLLL